MIGKSGHSSLQNVVSGDRGAATGEARFSRTARCALVPVPRTTHHAPRAMHPALRTPHPRSRSRRGGFTLIELLAVFIIIGIILGFVLVAGMDAANRSYERATQTLITKLEGGVSDRLEALLQTRPDYNSVHLALARIYNASGNAEGIQRAQVIAWYDYIKAEMPDVFFRGTDPNYPLNFAGNPYLLAANTTLPYPFVLPIGQGDNINPQLGVAGTGVYGASYTAAAGIYKNLGYLEAGYDGVDNNANNLVDESLEGVNSTNQALVEANLTNHRHSTARSEMLYALLVEGRGPLGSVFNRDDFTDKEVKDTDGDGLPEFVDAWGQPLQFYRWPLLYHSDIQRGQVIASTGAQSWQLQGPYYIPPPAPAASAMLITREQDPLDPNQQLVAPAWWSTYNTNNGGAGTTGASYTSLTTPPSGAVMSFEYFFHRLTEPYVPSGGAYFWDRGTAYGSRRAFYSKFLIVSGGPDQQVGIFRYPDVPTTSPTGVVYSPPSSPTQLIANENNAMPFALDVADFTANAVIQSLTIAPPPANAPAPDPNSRSSYDLQQAAQDDISNQNLAATGGIGGSG